MKRALQLVVALCSVGLILGMLVGRESLTTELAGVIGYSFFQVPPKSETGVSGYPKGLLEEKEPVMATKAPTPGLHKAAHAPAAINRTVVTVTFPEGGEQVNLVQPVDVGVNDTVKINVYKDAPIETQHAFKEMKERIDKVLRELKGSPKNPFDSATPERVNAAAATTAQAAAAAAATTTAAADAGKGGGVGVSATTTVQAAAAATTARASA